MCYDYEIEENVRMKGRVKSGCDEKRKCCRSEEAAKYFREGDWKNWN